ncbi:TlpA family protein disulfide reductase [Palleronia caenipelagi]|uniref:TlpA family protein disulfide reductase n=1 Tax=Palleronia caenipelagi TaxID=2489174 RepID=A0A547QA79_9RHOB|nr:TlpA disulfide reductase family protein [Palleronia caenipelagi]TRD23280.1 TlpA family protein disulfide reductase [Palleronia caenipelagi]
MRLFAVALYLAIGAAANAADLTGVTLEGDMRKLVVHSAPEAVPDLVVTTPEGDEVRLSDYAGTPLVLNFWATWCAPCREEMPDLDAMQRDRDGALEVLTIATGRNSVEGIEEFFADESITDLPVLLDPKQVAARQMAVLGLPVTVLVDAEGREVARLTGGAHWKGEAADAVIDALVGE